MSLVNLELSLPFASRFPTCFLLLPLSGKTGEIFRWKHGKRGRQLGKAVKSGSREVRMVEDVEVPPREDLGW